MADIPTIIIIFGATGDLMKKKIVPALLHLFEKEKLPKLFQVVGFSKKEFSPQDFSLFIEQVVKGHKDIALAPGKINNFLKLFFYHRGFFEDIKSYKSLAEKLGQVDNKWKTCANKLFYIAGSPQMSEEIFRNLSLSRLTKPCSAEEGWTRVIVEKPFGADLLTNRKLEKLLAKLFKEIQIYRIDHYLAKEMLQNILAFRFSNNLFESVWSGNFIDKIEIRLLEKIGVEDRGAFYDGVGALRDVGQNHLLQMLALITMDNPAVFNDAAIRGKRTEVLKSLIVPAKDEIKRLSFRGQYDGYRKIEGVLPGSSTETYFKVRAFLSSGRWQNVPIILESGKRLKEQRKEIAVYLKHPSPCLCPGDSGGHYRNKIIFSLEPMEGVTLQLWKKRPGLSFEIEEKDCVCSFRDRAKMTQYAEEYEKLFYDCIVGDQTLFVSSDEVEAMWKFIDPIVMAWSKNAVPLKSYKPDTDQPSLESKFIEESQKQSLKVKKEIGIIGMGKMGKNIALRLREFGWRVLAFDNDKNTERNVESLADLAKGLSSPRLIWLMIPAGKSVDDAIFSKNGLVKFLSRGDIIIDGGNSFYRDSITRFKKLKKMGIDFADVGVSGGPEGARHGASLMVGGEKKLFQKLEPLFYDLSEDDGYRFFEGPGAGHFVKMVHNGIEYGMMQAIAEGFVILKKAKYKLNLTDIAEVYNKGSVIESRLIGWLKDALILHGDDFKGVSGAVGHTGEAEWTVKTAKELHTKARVIEEAVKFRVASERNPTYAGKVLSALREQFGGHKAN